MSVNYHSPLHNKKLLELNLLCILLEQGGSQLQCLILSWHLNVYPQYEIWQESSWYWRLLLSAFCSPPNLGDFCAGTSPASGLQESSTVGLQFRIALGVPRNVVNANVPRSSQKLTCQLPGRMRVVHLYVSPLGIFYREVVVKRWQWKVTE